MDEAGNVTYLSEEDVSVQAICSHSFKSATISEHRVITTGGCTVTTYRCQLCTKCNYTKNKLKQQKISYEVCKHK